MKKVFVIFFVCMSLCTIAFSAEEVSFIEGTIDSIEPDHITMSGMEYKLVNSISDNDTETKYWVGESKDLYQIDFNTLYGVGYVDKARVTLQDGIVREIEVLELLQ
jgi:hypothetical protein